MRHPGEWVCRFCSCTSGLKCADCECVPVTGKENRYREGTLISLSWNPLQDNYLIDPGPVHPCCYKAKSSCEDCFYLSMPAEDFYRRKRR